MLQPLKDIAKNAMKLNARRMLRQVLRDKTLQAQIIDLNTESQLYERGVDSRGVSLGEYSPVTIQFYKPRAASMGRDGRSDHVTLKDTGAFYRSFRFVPQTDGFAIAANAMKDDTDLVKEFGPILGLDEKSIQEILPEIKESIRQMAHMALLKGRV